MKRYIYAALNESMPSWVKQFTYGKFNNRMSGISDVFDLYRGEYIPDSIPTSNRDKRLKDPNRLNLFLIPNRRGKGVAYAYNDRLGGWIPHAPEDDNYTPLPWKDIIKNTIEFGYVEAEQNAKDLKNLRQSRAEAKKDAIALQRGVGRLLDKSGYANLNPQRYKEILIDRQVADIPQTLDKMDLKISKLKIAVAQAVLDLDNGNNERDYFGNRLHNAVSYLENLIQIYSSINDIIGTIDEINKAYDAGEITESRRDSRLDWQSSKLHDNIDDFNRDYKYLLEYLPSK